MNANSNEPAMPLGRNTDFIRLWTGGAASGLGATITNLAYPLLALSVTSSAGLAGLLGVVALTAGTVIRLPAGAVVDRVPLRRLLVGTDVVRIITTAALIASVVTGHLALWQLLVVAGLNASAGAFRDVAHSVALRHVVSPTQLPQACAANEGRGHAISLIGQPVGGLLYGVTPALPLVADLASFSISATLSAGIRHRLAPPASDAPRPRFRQDLLTGLHFLWSDPFLRGTLLAAAAFQFVFAATIFALIAGLDRQGSTATSLGALFAVAAVGGILGALIAPALQSHLSLKTIVVIMGWTSTVVFAAFGWVHQPVLAGALLGCTYVTATPANAVLFAAQLNRTPAHRQGRVMVATLLIAGLAAPLGPPTSGILLDAAGPSATYVTLAALTAIITLAVHLNQPMRTHEADR
ncbi:MAG: MFS transporter [Humibacillus sp.]|nr:MFS transporter [Humibacillus sp.]